MTVARDVYTARELGRMFRPRSVAVVGASPTPGNFGQRTIDNLRHFAGPVYAVNPKYDRVGDKPCFASLADLPEAPDCVVLTVPRMGVEPLVEEAAAIGAGGIVVYASGYAETAREDREREQERLAAIAKAGRLPLMGPNCLGIVNHATRCGMTFMVDYHATPDLVGPIGVASQSGALGYLVVQAPHRGMGFSFFLASGNSCDIDICDLASFLVDDPATRSIVLILEGIKSGERFFQMAERARAADKALIIHKATRGAVSRRAAHRHTGTIAGEDAAYRAAFARAGAVVVEEHEAVLETASFFAKAPRPSGKGPAIVATSGGAGVIAATKAEEAGVHLPRPDAATQARLAKEIPDYGTTDNPCDVTGQVLNDFDSYARCLRAFLDHPDFDTVIFPVVFAHPSLSTKRVDQIRSVLKDYPSKLFIAVWMAEWLEGPGSETYEGEPRTALFRSMARCMRTLVAWRKRARHLTQVPVPRLTRPRAKPANWAAILAAYGLKSTQGNVRACRFRFERDRRFGPLVSFGANHFALAPLDEDAVAEVKPVALRAALRRLAELALDHGDDLAGRIVDLDARGRVISATPGAKAAKSAQRPRARPPRRPKTPGRNRKGR